jgi:hypothetical protein
MSAPSAAAFVATELDFHRMADRRDRIVKLPDERIRSGQWRLGE